MALSQRLGYWAVVGALLLVPRVALAQSLIAGVVRDTSGAVLPSVTVEASSPALIEKVRGAVTDSQGRYTIVELRPGLYTVTFELAGFRTFRREGIEVAANVSVPLSAELEVGAVEESVTITGQTPVVDVQQAGQRQVLKHELLESLPTSRQYHTAGIVMPGMKVTAPTQGGTSSTIVQSYLTARSRSGAENVMEVEGMDVRSPRGDNQQAYNNFAMAQEVTYQINAISADASGGGIRINMIPREGGNTFAGDMFISGMSHSWQSNNITPELMAAGLPTPDATRHMFELTPAFGGRIIRDRLWFFASGRLNRIQLAPAGARYADGRPGYNGTRTDNGSGRITWQVNPRNKLTVYRDEAWRYQDHYLGRAGQDWATVPTIWPTGTSSITSVKWTSPVSNRLLLEGGYSAHGYANDVGIPQPGVLKERGTPEWYANASRTDLVLGTTTVASGDSCCNYFGQPARVLQSAVSYVTGSHSFKTGIQWRTGGVRALGQENNAALQQRYRNGVPDSVSVSAQPSDTKAWVNPDVGIYAQDAWTLRRLTLNVGVRFEYWDGEIRATQMGAGRFVPTRSVDTFRPLPSFSDVNPRLSAVYDLFGNARTALKMSASRYVSNYGAVRISSFNPISTTSDIRNWFDCDFIPGTSACSGRILATNGDNIAQDNEIGPTNNLNFGRSPALRADPSLKREYNWDYSVSVQHEPVPRVSVVGSWYYTRFGNLQGTRNVLVSVSDYTPFQAINPLDASETITIYNLNRSKQGLVDNVVRTSDINRRTYNGFEGSVQARLANGGTLVGGWFADRTVAVTCDTNDPNQLRFCDQSGHLYQDLGRVPALPFRHEFKLALSSPILWKFTGAVSFTSFPGVGGFGTGNVDSPPYLSFGWVFPAALFPGGRTQSVTVPLNAPGTKYLPRWNQLDISVQRVIHTRRVDIQPGISVFNVLNSSAVLNEIQTFGSALEQPLNTLQGRFMKIEALIKF